MFLAELWKRHKRKKMWKELRNSVRTALVSDDDIMSGETRSELLKLKDDLAKIGSEKQYSEAALAECAGRFERTHQLPSSARSIRNFLDVLIVACTVAGGIRALYLQPFSIPTSSMQPTLFGIHYVDRKASAPFMGPVTRAFMPFQAERAKLTVKEGGELGGCSMSSKFLFFTRSHFQIGQEQCTLPGDLMVQIRRYLPEHSLLYQPGETFCDGWLSTGDHVFVERFSIHFRKLKRGDLIVFNTENITSTIQEIGGYYYIKRLAGLPGDTLKIENSVLMIKPENETSFRPAYEFSPSFRKLYSFQGGYQGHRADGQLSEGYELTVPENCYFALGDNTNHSFDGRGWGFIPRENMVGLAVFIFWPVSRRWGIPDRLPPLNTPTVMAPGYQPTAMSMQ